jgi:hypothetical protein
MVAAMDGVLEVKMSGQRRQLVGVMIKVMAVTGCDERLCPRRS